MIATENSIEPDKTKTSIICKIKYAVSPGTWGKGGLPVTNALAEYFALEEAERQLIFWKKAQYVETIADRFTAILNFLEVRKRMGKELAAAIIIEETGQRAIVLLDYSEQDKSYQPGKKYLCQRTSNRSLKQKYMGIYPIYTISIHSEYSVSDNQAIETESLAESVSMPETLEEIVQPRISIKQINKKTILTLPDQRTVELIAEYVIGWYCSGCCLFKIYPADYPEQQREEEESATVEYLPILIIQRRQEIEEINRRKALRAKLIIIKKRRGRPPSKKKRY